MYGAERAENAGSEVGTKKTPPPGAGDGVCWKLSEDAVGAVHVLELTLCAGIHIEIDVGSGLQVSNAGVQLSALRLNAAQLVRYTLRVADKLTNLAVGFFDGIIKILLELFDLIQALDNLIQFRDDSIQTAFSVIFVVCTLMAFQLSAYAGIEVAIQGTDRDETPIFFMDNALVV